MSIREQRGEADAQVGPKAQVIDAPMVNTIEYES